MHKVLKTIFYTPIYLFALSVLILGLVVGFALLGSVFSQPSDIYLVMLLVVSMFIPLLITLRKERMSNWWKSSTIYARLASLGILVPLFLVNRVFLLSIVKYTQESIRSLGIFYLIMYLVADSVYWQLAIKRQKNFEIPYIYYFIGLMSGELFVLLILNILISAI